MSRYTQIVILCEDRQQEAFARYFLLEMLNISPNRLRVIPRPSGQGSGEHFVRKQYPLEVQAFRSRKHLKICFVVILDADTGTTADHLRQLERELTNHSLDARQPDEKIAIFIPKRDIETWIHWLTFIIRG